ncbi:MAG: hypothetical protein ACJ8AT_01625 [Hyalangium sp.]
MEQAKSWVIPPRPVKDRDSRVPSGLNAFGGAELGRMPSLATDFMMKLFSSIPPVADAWAE